jgi:hypothetical protein
VKVREDFTCSEMLSEGLRVAGKLLGVSQNEIIETALEEFLAVWEDTAAQSDGIGVNI